MDGIKRREYPRRGRENEEKNTAMSLLSVSPELPIRDWNQPGRWDVNNDNLALVQEWNPFLTPLGEEEKNNLKLDVNCFIEVPEINIEC